VLAFPKTGLMMDIKYLYQMGSNKKPRCPKLKQYWNIYIINEQVMTTINYLSK